MSSSRVFLALLRKEIITAITNQVFVLLFGVPVVIATFLGLAFSLDRQAASPVALVLPSTPGTAEQLESALGALPSLRVVKTYRELQPALMLAREGRAVAVIDLSQARVSSSAVEGSVAVIVDETRPVAAEVVRATIQAWASQWGTTPPVSVRTQFLRGLSPRDTTIPLWLLLATLSVSLGSVPLLVTDEKEHRTLEALLVTPLGSPTIVLVKATVGIATILLMCVLIVVLTRTAVANPLLLVGGLLVGATSMVCIGLLIGTVAQNQASAAPVASVLMLVFLLPVILSQLESTPLVLAAQVLPTFQLNAIISASLFGGATIQDSAARLAYLGALGIAGSALAMWLMDQERALS